MNVSSSNSHPAFERPDSATLFKKTDANGDGKITQEELVSALEARAQDTGKSDGPSAEDLFSQLDADGNGEITTTEHETGLAEMESGGMRPAAAPSSEQAADLIDVLAPLLDHLAAQDEAAGNSTGQADSQTSLNALIEQLMAELKSRGDATNLYEGEA